MRRGAVATHSADERVLGSRMACLIYISPFDQWIDSSSHLFALQKLQDRGAMRRFRILMGRELTGYSIKPY